MIHHNTLARLMQTDQRHLLEEDLADSRRELDAARGVIVGLGLGLVCWVILWLLWIILTPVPAGCSRQEWAQVARTARAGDTIICAGDKVVNLNR